LAGFQIAELWWRLIQTAPPWAVGRSRLSDRTIVLRQYFFHFPSPGPGSVSLSNNNVHYQVRLHNSPSKKNIKQVKYIWSEIKKEKARQMAFVDIWLQSTKFLIFFCMYKFFFKVFVDNCFKRKRVWYESLVLKMKLSLLCVNPCVIFPLQYLTPYWIERACTLIKY
jgi:hypothetical protein